MNKTSNIRKHYSLDLRDLPGEVWKDIEGLEGIYQVSNKGRVKSLDRYKLKVGCKKPVFYPGKILKLDFNHGKASYTQNCVVNLSLGYMKSNNNAACKGYIVSRLVAKAFIPNPNNYDTVLHKDNDISNNCVENLQWISGKDFRTHYHNKDKMGPKKKKVLCVETGVIYNNLQEAACAMGCKLSSSTKSNHVGLTKALQKLTVSAGNYKPNPEQIWHGYHWKVVDEA